MAVDVIVCAHNEEPTIGAVVQAIMGAPSLGRCIVVADRCSDRTAEIAGELGALVLHRDAGDKGSAMAAGLEEAVTETVAFVDADLSGLTSEHVEVLLTQPPRPGMVCMLRDGAPLPLGRFPAVTGERRVPRRLAEEAGLLGSGWEAEMRINAACVEAGLPWAHVVMWGVKNPPRRKPEEWAEVAGATLKNARSIGKMLWHARKVK